MRKLSLGFALLFLLQLGVSAPQSSSDRKPSSSPGKAPTAKNSISSVATPQALGDEIVKYFGRKTGKELMAEKAGNMAGAGAMAAKTVAGKAPVRGPSSAAAVKPGYVPPPPIPRVSVPQIRQDIQRILELNKQIKNVQSGSSVQMQRVQDQARIHQKILNELENSQKKVASQKPPPTNALLSQEKIRIIHEETQRNAQMIEDLKAVPAPSAPSIPAKVTSKVKTSAS